MQNGWARSGDILRATLLLGLSDELVTIPDKIVSQAQIANFTNGQAFLEKRSASVSVWNAMIACVTYSSTPHRRGSSRAPRTTRAGVEAAESWLLVKLAFCVEDYGRQFIVTDKVITAALSALEDENVALALASIYS